MTGWSTFVWWPARRQSGADREETDYEVPDEVRRRGRPRYTSPAASARHVGGQALRFSTADRSGQFTASSSWRPRLMMTRAPRMFHGTRRAPLALHRPSAYVLASSICLSGYDCLDGARRCGALIGIGDAGSAIDRRRRQRLEQAFGPGYAVVSTIPGFRPLPREQGRHPCSPSMTPRHGLAGRLLLASRSAPSSRTSPGPRPTFTWAS